MKRLLLPLLEVKHESVAAIQIRSPRSQHANILTVFLFAELVLLVELFFKNFLGAPLALTRFGSGASGLPAPRLLRCARVCALTRAPYRPLAHNLD